MNSLILLGGTLLILNGILVSAKQLPVSASEEVHITGIQFHDEQTQQESQDNPVGSPHINQTSLHTKTPDSMLSKTQEMLRKVDQLQQASKQHPQPGSKHNPQSVSSDTVLQGLKEHVVDHPILGDDQVQSANDGHDTNKIIGGEVAPPGRWPWSVALFGEGVGFVCGGVIIARNWVLTAAHCVVSKPAGVMMWARIGATNLTANDHVDSVLVIDIIMHEFYDIGVGAPNTEYDIALLRLIRDANINDTDDTILSLPNLLFNLFELNPYCFIIGWGFTDINSESTSDVLMEKWVNVITVPECQQRWNQAFTQPTISANNLCTDEGIYGNISACHGDSGSPLQCYDTRDNTWKLAGLSSWGSSQCEAYPSVYIRAQSFLFWIQEHISGTQSKDSDTNQKESDVGH